MLLDLLQRAAQVALGIVAAAFMDMQNKIGIAAPGHTVISVALHSMLVDAQMGQ